MICGGFFFLGGSISILLASSLSEGGTLIEVGPRLEERYLSLDRHYATNLDWEHRWLYVPDNERPPLLTFCHDQMRPDLPESWSRMPTLS